MNALLKLSYENNYGNLIWTPPYLYPIDDLESGIRELKNKGYWVSCFPEDDGLSFKKDDIKLESFIDFEIAFPWMNITNLQENEEFDYEKDLLNSQIIILPLTRLRIGNSIYSKEICAFPAGEFQVEKINFKVPEKFDVKNIKEKGDSHDLRDLITSVTELDREVFNYSPVVVFRDSILIEEYSKFSHKDDVDLIKKYSENAENLLDIIRFFECDYSTPDVLPARAGIWDGRYSTSLLYFPKYQVGFVQAREVEIKTFIKGIGVDLNNSDIINNLPIFIYRNDELGEVGRLCKYALKLNTLIAESDNQSNKFIQIMILLEYIGDPFQFKKFQEIKGKLIAYIAKDRTEYHNLSKKFIYYSKDLRTQIIHNGKRIEKLLSQDEIDEIFKFFHKAFYVIIWDLIQNFDQSWDDYTAKREIIRQQLIS